MREKQPLSTLSLAILGLISQGPRSGYDLRKAFATTPMGHFSMSAGAIYPALKRLEESGLVRGTVERKRTLRPREVYALTEEGREALRSTLLQPIGRDDVIWRMDNLMLRFAFIGDVCGHEQAIAYLKALATHTESYVRELKGFRAMVAGRGAIYGRLTLQHGLASYAATARWARHAAKELEKAHREPAAHQ